MPSFLEIGRKPVLLPRSFWAPRGQRRGATSWTPQNKETPPEHPKPWGSRPYPQSGRPDSDRRPPEPHSSTGWAESRQETTQTLGRAHDLLLLPRADAHICRFESTQEPAQPTHEPAQRCDPATSGLQSLAQGGPFAIRFRCSLLTRLTRTPPALSARTSLSGSRTPSPRPSTHQEDPSGGRGRPTKRDAVPAGYTLLESGRRC